MKLCSPAHTAHLPPKLWPRPLVATGRRPACHVRLGQPGTTAAGARRQIDHTRRPGTLQPPAAAAAAAATLSYDAMHNSYLNDSRTADAAAKPVAPLPAPPASSSDWGVLPYLWELALAERAMSWRIGAAFACMLMSKAAGGRLSCVCAVPPTTACSCIAVVCVGRAGCSRLFGGWKMGQHWNASVVWHVSAVAVLSSSWL